MRWTNDPAAWGEMQAECVAWEETLGDGLAPDESWTEEGEVRDARP
jgi:hypothetical protein